MILISASRYLLQEDCLPVSSFGWLSNCAEEAEELLATLGVGTGYDKFQPSFRVRGVSWARSQGFGLQTSRLLARVQGRLAKQGPTQPEKGGSKLHHPTRTPRLRVQIQKQRIGPPGSRSAARRLPCHGAADLTGVEVLATNHRPHRGTTGSLWLPKALL